VQPILSRAKCCRKFQQPQISWSASISTARGFAHINILSGQAQFCSNLTFHGNLRTCRRYILRGLSRRALSISTAVVVFNAWTAPWHTRCPWWPSNATIGTFATPKSKLPTYKCFGQRSCWTQVGPTSRQQVSPQLEPHNQPDWHTLGRRCTLWKPPGSYSRPPCVWRVPSLLPRRQPSSTTYLHLYRILAARSS